MRLIGLKLKFVLCGAERQVSKCRSAPSAICFAQESSEIILEKLYNANVQFSTKIVEELLKSESDQGSKNLSADLFKVLLFEL